MSEEWDVAIAKQQRWAQFATLAIYAFIVSSAIFILLSLAIMALGIEGSVELLELYGIAAIVVTAVFILVSVPTVAAWIYRAQANLQLATEYRLDISPGWAVGWFFVPFANLVKPYEAMKQLWSNTAGSADPDAGSPLGRWWGCFLVGGISQNIGARMLDSVDMVQTGLGITAAGSCLRIAAAWFLIDIIRTVTASQSASAGIAETFA